MAEVFRMIINGRPANARSGESFEVRNPANVGEVVGVVAKGDRDDVREAIRAASAALESSWWPRIYESRRRGKVLQRFAALVEDQKDQLARLLTREQGKIYRESIGELDSLISTFDYYAGYAGKIAGEVKYIRDGDSIIKVETRKQPIGLCAAILPFNFPVSLYAWKVAPALIAGNAVLIKPASTTPLTDIMLTSLLQEAGAPPGIASIVTGPASTVGDEILRHPAVKRIAFTGSTEVGRLVAQAASPALKHVTLELGGSDPTVVATDADLEMATDTIVRFGRFRNAGQSCTSVKRVYVFASIYERFVDMLAKTTAALRVGDGLVPETDMGPLNNEQQRPHHRALHRRDRIRDRLDQLQAAQRPRDAVWRRQGQWPRPGTRGGGVGRVPGDEVHPQVHRQSLRAERPENMRTAAARCCRRFALPRVSAGGR